MSINSYLTRLRWHAILRDREKQSIGRSLSALESRLQALFGRQITGSFVFGSYSRGTILPRSMDARSDVDYTVVFADRDRQPQTYLDRLRAFADQCYARSSIAQSHPTVALELNHIRFELVPAIHSWFSGLQIPARASDDTSWQDTDPTGFNEALISANQSNGNLIKPLVRIMKYWNANAGYPFESYALEQTVVETGYGFFGLFSSGRLDDYYYRAVDGLDAGWAAPQSMRNAVDRLKDYTSRAQEEEQRGNLPRAEAMIQRLLPPVGGLLGA